MVKYFIYPCRNVHGTYITDKIGAAKEINEYAEKNDLKIVQISVCENTGVFVVFEKPNYCPNCGADMRKEKKHETD